MVISSYPTCLVNPDWNEEEEEEEVIVLDDDIDIEEDWLEDSTCALEEDWKEEDEDWFIVEEDFMDEVLTELLVWLKPEDSVDSSWKVASCRDSCLMELDWFASEKLMLPPFCYLVKILELVSSIHHAHVIRCEFY